MNDHMTNVRVAAIAKALDARVPSLVTGSTVALVGSFSGAVRQLGSGTLLAVGDERFVVSAGHVLREAVAQDMTVGIGFHGGFVACVRNWMLTGVPNDRADEHDIALYRFTSEEVNRLSQATFAQIGDASFEADLSNSYFVVSGFPALWTTTIDAQKTDPMVSRMLVYGTTHFDGDAAGLEGFDPKRHFLLQANRHEMYNQSGNRVSLRSRLGHPVDFPAGLQGISGCSVWRLGKMSTPPQFWGAPRLVGVETAVYARSGAIRATRWNSVTTLLYEAFPTTRAAIEFHIQLRS